MKGSEGIMSIELKEETVEEQARSLWEDALRRLVSDKLALTALVIVGMYIFIALLTTLGFIAADWDQVVGQSYEAPSMKHWLGTDLMGQSVLSKVLKGAEVAITIGLIVGIISVVIGVTLGSIAGYFGGLVDELIIWICSTISSIPYIMLLIAITYILPNILPKILFFVSADSLKTIG